MIYDANFLAKFRPANAQTLRLQKAILDDLRRRTEAQAPATPAPQEPSKQ